MAHSFRTKCLNTDEKFQQESTNSLKRKQHEAIKEFLIMKKPKLDVGHISITKVGSDNVKPEETVNDFDMNEDNSVHDETEMDELEKSMAEIHSVGKEKNPIEVPENETQDTSEENAKVKEQQNKMPKSRIIVKKFSMGPEIHHVPFKEPEKQEQIYKSEVGIFEGCVLNGPLNNTFYTAGGYVYEFGLVKQGVR